MLRTMTTVTMGELGIADTVLTQRLVQIIVDMKVLQDKPNTKIHTVC